MLECSKYFFCLHATVSSVFDWFHCANDCVKGTQTNTILINIFTKVNSHSPNSLGLVLFQRDKQNCVFVVQIDNCSTKQPNQFTKSFSS